MADILIIDDDPHIRRLMSRILQAAGHRVREAANGREGMRLFGERRADLVITDLVMPDAEGIETIRALRRDAPALPILAISGQMPAAFLDAAVRLGATAALEKPFGVDELTGKVDDLLGGARPG